MKKSILILAAVATTVGFAACSGSGSEGSMTKEQADSMAKARLDSAAAANALANDSLIRAQAAADAARLDSIRVADSLFAAGKKAGTTASKPSKPGKPSKPSEGPAPAPKPEEPKKPGGLRGNSDQNKTGGGLRGNSDQAKQKEQSSGRSGGGLRGNSDQAKQNGQ